MNGFFSMVAVTSDCGSTGIGNDNRTSHRRVSTTESEHGTAAKARREFVHAMEQLEDRIDKRFEEVNHRFAEVNQRLTDMQAEIRDVRSEMRQLNQNHIDHLSPHES